MPADWSRAEVEATVADYLAMLSMDLAGVPYNKAAHRRALLQRLSGRSESSVEFKHCNISAVLVELGFPYLSGYKRRSNYQQLLFDVVADRVASNSELATMAAASADAPAVVPEVDDILSILAKPPSGRNRDQHAADSTRERRPIHTNYLEREAHNRSLGAAGELFAINYERARLIGAGKEKLADRIEHTSRERGDGDGYDIRSFEESGIDRFIEVKTTKYGAETPFFVSRNERDVSEVRAANYHLYRLFGFRSGPRLFTLHGALRSTCRLTAASFMATVR
ncbi:MAG: DUF3883 domain-containing protein [Leptolyngbya sp. PLA3]|nr:DUF3883 domain-containing protein [Burkholderiales bacterium]MCE7970040.1 DUF3883 domain-containing protein [Leptolyngbya sp. PL-A3]